MTGGHSSTWSLSYFEGILEGLEIYQRDRHPTRKGSILLVPAAAALLQQQ